MQLLSTTDAFTTMKIFVSHSIYLYVKVDKF